MKVTWFFAGVALVVGCGSSPASPGTKTDNPAPSEEECTSDDDCDDGRFCNGFEACVKGACVLGDTPCLTNQTCREGAKTCETDCDATLDADGDGHNALTCGGDDCDDSKGDRFPGNAEVCDDENVDEDCDGTTFGDRDADKDGFVDEKCCNENRCGDDCDDGVAEIHPTEAEVCDGLDNNCNGKVDDAAASLYPEWYPDADGDGARDAGAEATLECVAEKPGFTLNGTEDCDDDDPKRFNGNPEVCDGQDNDCDEDTHACTNRVAHGPVAQGAKILNYAETSTRRVRICPDGYVFNGVFGSLNFYSQLRLHCRELLHDPDTGNFTYGAQKCFWVASGTEVACDVTYSGSVTCSSNGLPVGATYYPGFGDIHKDCSTASFDGSTLSVGDGDPYTECPTNQVVVGIEISENTSTGDLTQDVWVHCATLLGREY